MARELHVTSPMMTGPGVLEVQTKLEAVSYSPGELDGVYGPAMAGAVRAFQRDHRLDVDGIAGPITRGALALATAGPAQQTASKKGLVKQRASVTGPFLLNHHSCELERLQPRQTEDT